MKILCSRIYVDFAGKNIIAPWSMTYLHITIDAVLC